MKVAILTNRQDNFHKPLAEGLSRMFSQVGVESLVLYDGLASLPRTHVPNPHAPSGWKERAYRTARTVNSSLSYRRLIRDLRTVDLAVIVAHVPNAYFESFFDDERFRHDAPHLPIVLYDLDYLATRSYWAKWILENNPEMRVPKGRHWGLDRYDYYLCVTEMSEWPVPPGAEAFSAIGINLVDPSLAVEPKKEFVALIDFERPAHLQERAVQVLACIDASIPFKVLHGHYPIADIRQIYRSCSVYFVAHRESFALPLCELQACGAFVLTPYSHWCSSHYLTRPRGDSGVLPTNFVVYNNDRQQLVDELTRLKKEYDAEEVFANFQREEPHFYYGNVEELTRFINLVKNGTVNPNSHKEYPDLRQLVQIIGELNEF
jgi:hypothetical protein